MSTVLSKVEKVFQQAFGEGSQTSPRFFGGSREITVRRKGTKIILENPRWRGIIRDAEETGGVRSGDL